MNTSISQNVEEESKFNEHHCKLVQDGVDTSMSQYLMEEESDFNEHQ